MAKSEEFLEEKTILDQQGKEFLEIQSKQKTKVKMENAMKKIKVLSTFNILNQDLKSKVAQRQKLTRVLSSANVGLANSFEIAINKVCIRR